MIRLMPSKYRRRDIGTRYADAMLRRLGEELRTARTVAGLSIRDLAAASGISRMQLRRLESAETQSNRRVLREFRELIRGQFPLDTRTVMAALPAGRLPDRGGIVVM
jgi:ribosome-binding protein aMBF1 (putative translation factor)